MNTAIVKKWRDINVSQFILDFLNISSNDRLELSFNGSEVIIRKASEEDITIEDLFEGFEGKYEEELVDFGSDVGNEVW